MAREHRESVRVLRMPVKSVVARDSKGNEIGETWKDTTGRWMTLCMEIKRLENTIWQQWELWHANNDSVRKLRVWLDKRKEEGVKAAGKSPVTAWPAELSKAVYRHIQDDFPHLSSRTIVLHLNVIGGEIRSRKASNGSLPGWCAILLCNEGRPSATRPQPVRFDARSGVIEAPTQRGGNYHIKVRLWRLDGPPPRKSIQDDIELHCKGKSIASQVAILKRIASGEYKFCGSMLHFDKKRKKWFVMLSYRMPVQLLEGLDNQTATFRCGLDCPFELVLPDGYVVRLSGRGEFVPETRRRIFLTRRSRASNHRHAHTSSKGHGRSRVMNWRWKYQKAWKDFVTRVNHIATAKAIRILSERGIGRVVYEQPEAGFADERFLATAGKDDQWRDATTWEFFQVGTFLKNKCQHVGIECEIVKQSCPESEPAEEVADSGV